MGNKVTIVGDLHCTNDTIEKVDATLTLAESFKNPIILLGDSFSHKQIIQGKAFNFLFNRIRKSKCHYTILVGNHDFYDISCIEHSMEAFKQLRNVDIVDVCKGILTPDQETWFLPYVHDKATFENTIKDLRSEAKLVFIHQGINGYKFHNGRVEDNCHDLTVFNNIELVIAGHFHGYQKLNNVLYLGTPYSIDFGESNQTKYIAICDTKSLEIELVETKLPQHITLDINTDETNTFAPQSTFRTEDYLRVILKGKSSSIAVFDHSSIPTGTKVIMQPTDVVQEAVIQETQDNETKWLTWCEEKLFDSNVKDLGLNILKEVK